MTVKCKKCNFKADASEFKRVLIMPGKGMDYACPKCDTMGIINGNLAFVVEVNTGESSKSVEDIIKGLKEQFRKKKESKFEGCQK